MRISTLTSFVIAVATAACGSSSEKTFDCAAICARANQCNPNVLVDTCQKDCAVTSTNLVDSAKKAVAECGGTCADISACQSGAIEQCSSGSEDVSPWIGTLCTAATQCASSTVTASQCSEGFTEADLASLRCFSAAARGQLLACVRSNCGQPDVVLDCGREVMPLLEELASGFGG